MRTAFLAEPVCVTGGWSGAAQHPSVAQESRGHRALEGTGGEVGAWGLWDRATREGLGGAGDRGPGSRRPRAGGASTCRWGRPGPGSRWQWAVGPSLAGLRRSPQEGQKWRLGFWVQVPAPPGRDLPGSGGHLWHPPLGSEAEPWGDLRTLGRGVPGGTYGLAGPDTDTGDRDAGTLPTSEPPAELSCARPPAPQAHGSPREAQPHPGSTM